MLVTGAFRGHNEVMTTTATATAPPAQTSPWALFLRSRDGAITICNHVFRWDYICVMKGIRPHLQYHPGWAGNYEGKDRTMVRLVGGIPIPAGNLPALATTTSDHR